MIITPTSQTPAAGPPAPGWVSLARRGMLWSDVQVFDRTVLAAHQTGPALDPDCHELLYCAAGSARITVPGGPALQLTGGQCLLLGPTTPDGVVTVTAGGHGATLLRIRALPTSTARGLPTRQPSLHPPGRTL